MCRVEFTIIKTDSWKILKHSLQKNICFHIKIMVVSQWLTLKIFKYSLCMIIILLVNAITFRELKNANSLDSFVPKNLSKLSKYS